MLRTPDVTGVDKTKLKQQILATIFSNGERLCWGAASAVVRQPRHDSSSRVLTMVP